MTCSYALIVLSLAGTPPGSRVVAAGLGFEVGMWLRLTHVLPHVLRHVFHAFFVSMVSA